MSHSPQQYLLGRVTLDLQYTLLLSVIRGCKYFKAARNSPSSAKGQLITGLGWCSPKGPLPARFAFLCQTAVPLSPLCSTEGSKAVQPLSPGPPRAQQQHQGWLPGGTACRGTPAPGTPLCRMLLPQNGSCRVKAAAPPEHRPSYAKK